jgi:hypothetical protein
LSSPSRLRLFYLLHLSKPASNRLIYREVRRIKPRSIVEIGIGTAERAGRILELACEFHEPRQIRYTSIDQFEDRAATAGSALPLREAHRLLKATGARIQLVPGTPLEALARTANALGKADLMVLSPWEGAQQLAAAWFYVPRMLHEHTVVLLETVAANGDASIRAVERAEIEALAGAKRRKAA